ncbi:Probable E3 ubiquitin-protein ligase RNF217 [Seminavis robusta]|uniref:RBR-type E3 ubiquitin transferase n=1 Tax=Seminavis robusta TaxID=568900 RepID=A0A9N8EMM3_9STRA|nr:Probable E3 ubiquitin-protein ligase RNF217 [Seminavis robusta]|eukprot:Sro1343_g264600.1 Probable E3 ubiquitin-protein ligase RNF217 (815) ;mRNA; r:8821-11436
MKWAPIQEARAQLAEYGDDHDDPPWGSAEDVVPYEPMPLASELDLSAFETAKRAERPKKRRKDKSNRPKARAKSSFWPTRERTLMNVIYAPQPRLYRSKSYASFLDGASNAARAMKRSTFSDDSSVGISRDDGKSLTARGNDLALACMMDFLPSRVILSGIGPTIRASMLLESTESQMAVLVLWKCDDTHAVRVVPFLTDEGRDRAVVTDTVAAFERLLNNRVKEAIPHFTQVSQHPYVRFLYTSNFLGAQLHDLTMALEQCLANARGSGTGLDVGPRSAGIKMWATTTRALKTLNTEPRSTLTYFDVFKMWHEGMLASGRGRTPNVEEEKTQSKADNPNCCLVCFDEILPTEKCNPLVRLRSCQHVTCRDCWIRYFASACRSGEASVKCPAFKCNNRIVVLDAAHVMFGDQAGPIDGRLAPCSQMEEEVLLLKKLVKISLNRFILLDRKGRHCPSPDCQRFFTRTPSPKGTSKASTCQTIWLCSCGLSLCGDCPISGNCRATSHPGISCESFAKVQKELDRARFGAILETLKWVLQFTRACPKCSFPIHRTGGCNHVRCGRCQKYFCWECGGPGERCNAYRCGHPSRYWVDANPMYREDHHNMKDLVAAVGHCRSYRLAEGRMTQIRQYGANKSLAMLELECLQAQLWLHSASIASLLDSETRSGPLDPIDTNRSGDATQGNNAVGKAKKRKEVLGALEARVRVALLALQHRRCSQKRSGLNASFLFADARTKISTTKILSKRKTQSVAAIAAKRNNAGTSTIACLNDEFRKHSEQQDLELLSQMSEEALLKNLQTMLKRGIHGLVDASHLAA